MVDSPPVMESTLSAARDPRPSGGNARRGEKSFRPPRLARPALLLLLVLHAAFPSCSLPDETAAVVNGRTITTAELEDSYEKFLGQFGEMSPPAAAEARRARKVLLDRLVDREIMLQEVERLNIRPSLEEVAALMEKLKGELRDKEFKAILSEAGIPPEEWRRKVQRDLSLERLQEQEVYRHLSVTDEEMETYLRRHKMNSDKPEEVRASQILVRTREEAVEARKRIRRGEPFAEVAKEISLSPDAEEGGDLGYFSRGQMPQEFDAVVFSLPKGKVSPVVETTYGHHLFLLTDRRRAEKRGEGEIRTEVRSILLAEKREKAFSLWLEGLRASAQVRYNEKVLSP